MTVWDAGMEEEEVYDDEQEWRRTRLFGAVFLLIVAAFAVGFALGVHYLAGAIGGGGA